VRHWIVFADVDRCGANGVANIHTGSVGQSAPRQTSRRGNVGIAITRREGPIRRSRDRADMANVIGIVHLPKMADIVAADLRRQIIAGELEEGDPLPPEDQLMQHAGVARTTVRGALRILESEGLLVVQRGAHGGARIRTPSVSNVARYIGLVLQCEGATLRDVYDARHCWRRRRRACWHGPTTATTSSPRCKRR
jgi:hypothetical protein